MRNRKSLAKAVLLLGLLSLVLFSFVFLPDLRENTPTPQEEPERPNEEVWHRLQPGGGAWGWLAAGQAHHYEVSLAAGQFVELIAEQDGVDVILRITTPDGEELPAVDGPTGTLHEERIGLVAATDGIYRMRVDAYKVEVPGRPGRYVLKSSGPRKAAERDRLRARADRVTFEAYALWGAEPRAAADRYVEAAELWRALGNRSRRAGVLWQAARIHRTTLHAAQAALELYGRALKEYRAASDVLGETGTLIEMSRCLSDLGDLEGADRILAEVTERSRRAGLGMREAEALNNLAYLSQQRGNAREALSQFRKALEIWSSLARQSGRHAKDLVDVHNGIGHVLLSLGDFEKSLDWLLKAQESCGEVRWPDSCAVTATRIGEIHARRGDLLSAVPTLRAALALREAVREPRGIANTKLSFGHALLLQGEYREAIDQFRAALSTFETERDQAGQAVALVFLGHALAEAGLSGEAFRAFSAAFESAGKAGQIGFQAAALSGKARVERQRGNLRIAERQAREAVRVVEGIREKSISPDFQTFFPASRSHHDLLVEILMDRHGVEPGTGDHAGLALAASERSRARALPEILRSRYGSPEASHRDPANSLDARQIQAELDSDSILLAYHFLEDRLSGARRLFLWKVTRDSLVALPIRQGVEKLEVEVQTLVESMEKDEPSQGLESARWLRRLLLPPEVGPLEGKRLVLVLDGPLLGLPFGLLPAEPEEEPGWQGSPWPRPLLWDHEIVVIPSVSALATLRRLVAARPPAPGLLALLSDPLYEPPRPASSAICGPVPEGIETRSWPRLPYTADEVRTILPLLPPGPDVFEVSGPEVNLELFRSNRLKAFRIIHIAAHGDLGTAPEYDPGIILSTFDGNGCPREARLRIEDLHRGKIELSADLVVLSACNTGLGRPVASEGLVGVTHGFMAAGVPRVIASFWSVSDPSTAVLMKHFYEHLFRGDSPAAALRSAQKRMIQDGESPFHWGAFALHGDWRWPGLE